MMEYVDEIWEEKWIDNAEFEFRIEFGDDIGNRKWFWSCNSNEEMNLVIPFRAGDEIIRCRDEFRGDFWKRNEFAQLVYIFV